MTGLKTSGLQTFRSTTSQPTKRLLHALAALAVSVASLTSYGPAWAAEGPFTGLSGSWSGTGQIVLSSGSKERIRCKANYSPDAALANLRIELRCASDSYNFELKSDVANSAGKISGSWSETTKGGIGSISGTGTPGRIDVSASGPTFSAQLAVATRGSRQTISIQSPGSEMREVTITMAKGK